MASTSIDDRHLRLALEFAVAMAEEGQKFRPPMESPAGLKKYMKMSRIPAKSLPPIRRLVDGDEKFRKRIAAGALPELVDPVGQLWLRRPKGWKADARAQIDEIELAETADDAAKQLKKSEKRRQAAERATVRGLAELVVLQEQLGERSEILESMRSDAVKLNDNISELHSELIDTRNELRHARDRTEAATAKFKAAEGARDAALVAQGNADQVRDVVLADRAVLAAERSELARLAATAQTLAAQLEALAVPIESGTKRRPAKRSAMPMPGGVLGSSVGAAEHLLRSDASVLIDGYNVSMLAWPKLDLEGQRVVLLDSVENLARRFGSDITVVFDGADVVGAASDGRRIIRVVYSPEGVIADDVIRDEVQRLPATRHVVVVTNDREIVRDVKAAGANTITSEQLLALIR